LNDVPNNSHILYHLIEILHDGLGLAEGGDFETINFLPEQRFDRSTKFNYQLTSSCISLNLLLAVDLVIYKRYFWIFISKILSFIFA